MKEGAFPLKTIFLIDKSLHLQLDGSSMANQI